MTDSTLSRLRRSRPQDTEGRVRLTRQRMRAAERSGIPCEECGGSGFYAVHTVYVCSHGTGPCEDCRMKPVPCPECNGTGYLPLIEGVRLGAYLGDEACRVVVPAPGCMWDRSCACSWWEHALTCGGCSECDDDGFVCLDEDMTKWASGLSRWGRMACARAGVAANHAALGAVERREEQDPRVLNMGYPPLRDESQRARGALAAARKWVACQAQGGGRPCEVHRGPVRQALSGPLPHWSWLLCVYVIQGGVPNLVQAVIEAAEDGGEEPVRSAIREALVPWALGEPE